MVQCNLHQHSEGSFLDGLASVKDIARRAREVGSDAVAITDHNECNQHIAFQNACSAEGIHPVFGIEADWVPDLNYIETIKAEKRYPKERSHICLLAANNVGLSNIWAMSSLAYTEKYRHYKPLVTLDLMREYSEGVYASDGCMITEIGRAIEKGDEGLARQHFATLLDIFGDNFYSELHTWQFMEADTDEKRRLNELMYNINQAKVRFATEMGVPLVIVNDAHHAYPEQWENKELVWKFKVGSKGDDQEVNDYGQKADHLMGEDEVCHLMMAQGIPPKVICEAVDNSYRIAHSCQAEITKTLDMPRLTGSDEDDLNLLVRNVEKGFRDKVAREGLPEEPYLDRLQEEMTLISQKGFQGYFNLVEDNVRAAVSGEWAPYTRHGSTRQPMLCGPGRGSAGGCLVAYLLGITSLDPIHYGLLFERFLSPGRQDWPDIDVDFPQSLRQGEKGYLEARHHADHVCTIGTLSRSQPKALLRDLGRAMEIPLYEVNQMTKIIEQVKAIEVEVEEGDDGPSWQEVLERKGGELSQWANKYPQLFEKINEFQGPDKKGTVRGSSKHASGVVVSNKPILGTIPTRVKNKQVVTQFDMYEVEMLGAVKLDLLGLRHLDTLMHARDLIYARHGVWLDYRNDKIRAGQGFGPKEFADPAIWPQIHKGHTTGIFQLETADLSRKSTQLLPLNEVDVAALISIVRPGVKDAGLEAAYLRRRAGVEPVEYDHPLMEPITKETYGILVYQEQLLRTVKDLAGFTPTEADDLRKALGKKKMDKVLAFKDKFVKGCQANQEGFMRWGGAEDVIGKIWSSIEAAGRYAFNKSHAVGYSLIACWEVWTKHYYPQEFLVALLATDPENATSYVREARRLGFKVLPPDINKSTTKFTCEDGAIRYGIDTVRGVGKAMSTDIQAGQPYKDLDDYLQRAGKGRNKTCVYNLIRIGAFDEVYCGPGTAATSRFHAGGRVDLLERLQYCRIVDNLAVSTLENEERLGKIVDRRLAKVQYQIDIPDFSKPSTIIAIEQELVGNYVTVDPMGPYIAAIENIAIKDPSEMDDIAPKTVFAIGGQISALKRHTIKKKGRNEGREMAFIGIEWNGVGFEVTAFPEIWDQVKDLMNEGDPVLCEVIRDERGAHLKSVARLDLMLDGE